MRFRVATWNLDHASNKRRPIEMQLKKIHSINAHIWVLTETCDQVDLSPLGYQCAVPKLRNKYKNYWTTVWTCPQMSIVKQLPSYDNETVTFIEIATPEERLLVYGTILTWKMDGVREGTSKPWDEHHKAIDAHGDDWARLRALNPGKPLIVAGDFNQTRDGSRKYCSTESVAMLTAQLERNDLVCVTQEDFGKSGKLGIDPKKGYYRHNIDHICLTSSLQTSSIGVWDHFLGEQELSDHNGVFADVTWRP